MADSANAVPEMSEVYDSSMKGGLSTPRSRQEDEAEAADRQSTLTDRQRRAETRKRIVELCLRSTAERGTAPCSRDELHER